MQEIVEKNKCCGCYACINKCPQKAIFMRENEFGFSYPVIDSNKCINCGLCQKVCPIINRKEEIKKDIITYACYNKNITEQLNSSSGGIFILLAKEIIRRNGVVFGAVFDNNFNVVHSYIEKISEIKKMMGSKYVQSSIREAYQAARFFLDNGRYVLFTGTPCQIEGLKCFLGKEYDKLYTQDIICHGVPAPKLWQKYIDYQKKRKKENIKSISFRNKDSGWKSYRIKIVFDSKLYSKAISKDIYMKFFLNNMCLRESCYICSFKKKYRESDITIADYWGIENNHPDLMNFNGVSLVILNSKKGIELFEAIKNNIKYSKTDFENAIKYNMAMTHSVEKNKNYDRLSSDIQSMNFKYIARKYFKITDIFKKFFIKLKRRMK